MVRRRVGPTLSQFFSSFSSGTSMFHRRWLLPHTSWFASIAATTGGGERHHHHIAKPFSILHPFYVPQPYQAKALQPSLVNSIKIEYISRYRLFSIINNHNVRLLIWIIFQFWFNISFVLYIKVTNRFGPAWNFTINSHIFYRRPECGIRFWTD